MAFRFIEKPLKGEEATKTPYTIHSCHPDIRRAGKMNEIIVVSIDPATKNFAMRIEIRNKDKVTPLVFIKTSFLTESSDEEGKVNILYASISTFLNKYFEYYMKSSYIIIERQPPINYKSVRISQHLISYFLLILRDSALNPVIVEVDPHLKAKMLNGPKGIGKRELKKWSRNTAREISTIRGDLFSLDVMNKAKGKEDDLADTICQIEAFFKLIGLPSAELSLSMQTKDSLSGLLSHSVPLTDINNIPKTSRIRII